MDGRFKMRIRWPQLCDAITCVDGKNENIWYQTSNPVFGKPHGGAEGYEPISVPYSYRFGGLERGSTSSVLDGTTNHGNWWYAIGGVAPFPAGIPGPFLGDKGIPQLIVELYVDPGSYTGRLTLTLDGKDDYIGFPGIFQQLPQSNSQYTMEAWIRPLLHSQSGIISYGIAQNNRANLLRLDDGEGLHHDW